MLTNCWRLKMGLVVAAVTTLSATVVHAQSAVPSVENRGSPTATANTDLKAALSPEDFSRAGLNKLSAEELRHLEILVRVRAQASAQRDEVDEGNRPSPGLPQGEAAFGKDTELQEAVVVMQQVPKEIRSRIVGPFKGWRGRTVFELENGQVWRQSEGGTFYVNMDSPEVTIRRGSFGTYFLKVEGHGSRTKVVRVN